MTRCIVNVATGRYVAFQRRLVRSLKGFEGDIILWTDKLPPESPKHSQVPYAFKAFAIREARRRGHRTILWLDAPCVALGSLERVFARIERQGHSFTAGRERLGNWASDACLDAFGLDRDAAMKIRLIQGTFLGLDFGNSLAQKWFRRFLGSVKLFADNVSADPRFRGHRHDEAVGTCLAHLLGMRARPARDLAEIAFRNSTPR